MNWWIARSKYKNLTKLGHNSCPFIQTRYSKDYEIATQHFFDSLHKEGNYVCCDFSIHKIT